MLTTAEGKDYSIYYNFRDGIISSVLSGGNLHEFHYINNTMFLKYNYNPAIFSFAFKYFKSKGSFYSILNDSLIQKISVTNNLIDSIKIYYPSGTYGYTDYYFYSNSILDSIVSNFSSSSKEYYKYTDIDCPFPYIIFGSQDYSINHYFKTSRVYKYPLQTIYESNKISDTTFYTYQMDSFQRVKSYTKQFNYRLDTFKLKYECD
jgi:hypothetical protein